MENNTQNSVPFTANLLTGASRELVKNNDAKSTYVIYTAEIKSDGPLKGQKVSCAFTTKNAQGEMKERPSKGDEVTIYGRMVNGKPLFEVSQRVETADDAVIAAGLEQAFQALG